MPKESFEPFPPHNTIEEMEVEMILLNLTDDTGKHKEGGSGGGGGGDEPDPNGGGGSGRSGPNPAGSRIVADPGTLSDKMNGKEPEIFTGD